MVPCFRFFAVATAILLSLLFVSSQSAAEKPNIVFILADDLGYGDLACYGHPYAKTPALDQLAREGSMFKSFHVTGVTCCPSRTGFMTSKFPATYHHYPADAGFGKRVTITELLHEAGYRTGHFGKWHIGPDEKPGTYGIETIGSDRGAESRARMDPRGRGAWMYDEAAKFIEANKDQPFYVNVWDHVPHFPVNPPKEYAERFAGLHVKESDFAEPMREKFEMVKKADGKLDEHMQNYLGELLAMDESIGRLLKRIDELGLREKTIVVFSSDQGAAPVRLPGEAAAAKAKKKKTDDRNEAFRLNMLGYGGGLRGGKHNMYEAGVRAPFIIRWPGHVPAGRVDQNTVTCGIDWLPTLCSIAGITPPGDIDGEDVSEVWLGKSRERTKPLFWKVNNVRSEVAILDGQWKLFLPGTRPAKKFDGVELYDLAKNPDETRNVAAEYPEIAQSLKAKALAWNSTLPTEYIKAPGNDEDK
jgi:arylsulfatase A-like enzyme